MSSARSWRGDHPRCWARSEPESARNDHPPRARLRLVRKDVHAQARARDHVLDCLPQEPTPFRRRVHSAQARRSSDVVCLRGSAISGARGSVLRMSRGRSRGRDLSTCDVRRLGALDVGRCAARGARHGVPHRGRTTAAPPRARGFMASRRSAESYCQAPALRVGTGDLLRRPAVRARTCATRCARAPRGRATQRSSTRHRSEARPLRLLAVRSRGREAGRSTGGSLSGLGRHRASVAGARARRDCGRRRERGGRRTVGAV